MKKKYFKYTIVTLIVISLFLSACTKVTQNEETDIGRYQPDWTRDAVIYEVNVRQYTQAGTFEAFSEHLQELKDMGINTLWFMPIHPISETKRAGTLGSYYSITDYREVNPEFGTKEDFAALVDKAHDMGFKVMMDFVVIMRQVCRLIFGRMPETNWSR